MKSPTIFFVLLALFITVAVNEDAQQTLFNDMDSNKDNKLSKEEVIHLYFIIIITFFTEA